MAKFTRAEIRAIIGEACTDEIENKLVALHLGVVDPLKDDLQKYKTEAEKIPGIQRQLDEARAVITRKSPAGDAESGPNPAEGLRHPKSGCRN